MSIEENLKEIKKEIPAYVTLIAVSKTKPTIDIEKAYKFIIRNSPHDRNR